MGDRTRSRLSLHQSATPPSKKLLQSNFQVLETDSPSPRPRFVPQPSTKLKMSNSVEATEVPLLSAAIPPLLGLWSGLSPGQLGARGLSFMQGWAISSTGLKTQRLLPENLTRTQTRKLQSPNWRRRKMVVQQSSQALEQPALFQTASSASMVRSAVVGSAPPRSFSPALTDPGGDFTLTSVSDREQTIVNIEQ